MRTKMILSVLALSAAYATPTLANYFHNPHTNLNLNVGSAPSPTPRDIRENRLPQLVHAAQSSDNVETSDIAKDIDKPIVNPVRGGEEKAEAQTSR